ncbi:unnamed protein product [Rotaria sp. Silwood1]|nr:unnamed protein product [Rotaria sp. Silwood1]
MSAQNAKQNISKSTPNTTANTTVSPTTVRPRRRITENYLVIWIDSNFDPANEGYQNTLEQLQRVANDIFTITQRDECIDFFTQVDD